MPNTEIVIKTFQILIAMKRIAVIIAAIAVLVGCQKEERVKGQTYAAFGYHTDAWDIAGMHFDGYDVYYVFRFIDETTAERTIRRDSPKGEIMFDIESCTYTYNHPVIEISYYNKTSQKNVVETGEFIDDATFRIGKKDYIRQ